MKFVNRETWQVKRVGIFEFRRLYRMMWDTDKQKLVPVPEPFVTLHFRRKKHGN